jgi:hypothetical protein
MVVVFEFYACLIKRISLHFFVHYQYFVGSINKSLAHFAHRFSPTQATLAHWSKNPGWATAIHIEVLYDNVRGR